MNVKRGCLAPSTIMAATLVQAVLALSVHGEAYGQSDILEFLQQNGGFSNKELEQLERGDVIIKVPKAVDNREVALLTAVRIWAPLDFILDFAQDVERSLGQNESVLQVGVFSAVASPEDAANLKLPEDDIKALRECEVGRCDVKLPATAIEALSQEIQWTRSDYAEQVNEAMAGGLAVYLESYKARGNDALVEYYDKSEPLSVAEGFRLLLEKSQYLFEYDPEFFRHLKQYPDASLTGVEDTFYWTVEDLGLKPVLHLNHMALRRQPENSIADALVGIKQIYASHYFQAGLKIYSIVSVSEENQAEGVYVTLFERKRFDGKVGGIKRTLLESRLKSGTAKLVSAMKSNIETLYRASKDG